MLVYLLTLCAIAWGNECRKCAFPQPRLIQCHVSIIAVCESKNKKKNKNTVQWKKNPTFASVAKSSANSVARRCCSNHREQQQHCIPNKFALQHASWLSEWNHAEASMRSLSPQRQQQQCLLRSWWFTYIYITYICMIVRMSYICKYFGGAHFALQFVTRYKLCVVAAAAVVACYRQLHTYCILKCLLNCRVFQAKIYFAFLNKYFLIKSFFLATFFIRQKFICVAKLFVW